MKRNSSPRLVIVLTGGPGGGKTTLVEELARAPAWVGRFVALPEAIYAMRYLNISPREKLFQRVMVHLQMALEDGLNHALDPDDSRAILCHRGSLDPLAYRLDRGWQEDEFFTFTGTTLEMHYQRYAAVLHLVTAADATVAHYKRWPDAHRPETPEQAVQLDRLLQRVWGGHPCYFRIDNEGQGWANQGWSAKSREARTILSKLL